MFCGYETYKFDTFILNVTDDVDQSLLTYKYRWLKCYREVDNTSSDNQTYIDLRFQEHQIFNLLDSYIETI